MIENVRYFNDGEITAFIRIPYSEIPAPEIINLGTNQTALMGKNGAGKTTVLAQMASTLFPQLELKIDRFDKYWSGGFVIRPFGARNGVHELVPKIKSEESPYPNMIYGDYRDAHNYGSSAFGISEDFTNNYYLAEFVLPSTLKFTRHCVREELSWLPEWDKELESELINQNKFCVIQHPVLADDYASFDKQYEPTPLILRVVEISEDTPRANKIRSEIIEFYDFFSSEYLLEEKKMRERDNLKYGRNFEPPKKVTFENFVRGMIYGNKTYEIDETAEYGIRITKEYPPITKNSLVTPFLLPWSLLTDDLGDYQDFALNLSRKVPNLLLEWPRQAFQEHVDRIISSAVDPHISEKIFKNDLEMLNSTISTGLGSGFESEFSSWNRDGKKEIHNKIVARASLILKEWKIVPEWIIEHEHNDRVSQSQHGTDFYLDTGNISYDSGEWASNFPNESTKRWIIRAIQVAVIEKFDTPYKILLWDEPERGLHPTAIEAIRYRIFPFLEKLKIKLVFTTHSMVLGNASSKIIKCFRTNEIAGIPQLSDVPSVSEEILEELGLSRFDLLSSISTLLVVEGEHDKIVLETFFGDQLAKERVRIITLGGTHELISLPDSEIIMGFLTTKIVILLDGGRRSILMGENELVLDQINDMFLMSDLDGANKLFKMLRFNAGEHSEGKKLFALIDLLLTRGGKDKNLLPRFSFQLLSENDVIHYLDPKLALAPYRSKKNWKELQFEYEAWKKQVETENKLLRHGAEKVKLLSEKAYYKKFLAASLSKDHIKRAAEGLLDVAPPADFEKLRVKLFGPSSLTLD